MLDTPPHHPTGHPGHRDPSPAGSHDDSGPGSALPVTSDGGVPRPAAPLALAASGPATGVGSRGTELPDHWPFSVSYSALVGIRACPRRWWLERPGAWQGWPGGRRSEDPLARLCYEGKQVQTLPAACGSAVHEAAEWAVTQTAKGRRGVTYDALWERVRRRLIDLAGRELDVFRLKPKLGILLPLYLGEPLPGDECALTRTVAQSACRRLVASEVLEHVRLLGRHDVLAVERLLELHLSVDGEPVTLYGKLDLAYVFRESTRFEDQGIIVPPGDTGIPVVADWKTGRGAAHDPQVRRQLAVGAYVATATRLLRPHPTVGVVARVCDLSPGGADDTVTFLGPRDLADAETWVRTWVGRLLQVARDAHGVPLMRAFPPRPSRACATCTMQRACALSVAQEG